MHEKNVEDSRKLQITVEELNTTSDELESRTLELQSEALRGEASRHLLRAILDAIDEAIVAIDSEGAVFLANTRFNERFVPDISTLDIQGSEGEPLSPEQSPFELATRGETFEMKVTIGTTNGKSCVNKISGRPVIVTSAPWFCVVTIRPVK